MTTGPRVVTVVVNYRHYDDTVRCVTSLHASTYLNHRVVIVDNTEPEFARPDLLEKLDSGVTVLSGGGNLGFAAGCNLGIQAAFEFNPRYIWLVNPDAVVSKDTMALLVATAEANPDAGVVGARILDGSTPPKILFNGGFIDASRKGAPVHPNWGALDSEVPDELREVDYVNGACFLLRTDVIREIGLLRQEYFLYYEETDYCMRARAAGWRLIIAPHARIWHYKRSTGVLPTSYYIYYLCRNSVYFCQRFFDASVTEVRAEMTLQIKRWRRRVAAAAPHLVDRFDALVELAFEDARRGRLGRRDDIGSFSLEVDEAIPKPRDDAKSQANVHGLNE